MWFKSVFVSKCYALQEKISLRCLLKEEEGNLNKHTTKVGKIIHCRSKFGWKIMQIN